MPAGPAGPLRHRPVPRESRCTITDWTWIETLTRQFDLCAVEAGQQTVILAPTSTDPRLVDCTRLALHRLGAVVTVVAAPAAAPERLASQLLDSDVLVAATAAADFVVDLSRPGLDRDPDLEEVLGEGSRVLVVDIDDPAELVRHVPHPGLTRRVDRTVRRLHLGDVLAIGADAGTNLVLGLAGSHIAGSSGVAQAPGSVSRWPAGHVSIAPAEDEVSGEIVMMPGDLNLTTVAFIRSPVRITVEKDHIADIDGDSSDADMVRATLEAGGSADAYAVAEVGWGMVRPPRRQHALFDPGLLAGGMGHRLEGVVRLAIGRDQAIGRSDGRLVLGLRACTVTVDGVAVIEAGALQGDLAPDVYEEAAIETVRGSDPGGTEA